MSSASLPDTIPPLNKSIVFLCNSNEQSENSVTAATIQSLYSHRRPVGTLQDSPDREIPIIAESFIGQNKGSVSSPGNWG